MWLWQVSLAGNSRSLIGNLPVIFDGTPNSDVANSLDSAYWGPFSPPLAGKTLILVAKFK